MAKRVKVVRDEAHQQMGPAYQCVLAGILDASLRENGVKSKSRRHEIARRSFSRWGNFTIPVGCDE